MINERILEFKGHFIHAHEYDLGSIDIFENYRALVDENTGLITAFEPLENEKLPHDYFYCPGFIDAHLHAPQYPNLGVGLDRPLLDWLKNVTIPTENRADIVDYRGLVGNLLRRGTTTAVYFGNVRKHENERLLEAVINSGQRAFIGKVCMDISEHSEYKESTSESLAGSIFFEGTCRVKPIITPRFALSCSDAAMRGLAKLASDNKLLIQTHIAENREEVWAVKKRFPGKTYAQVYESMGLLTDRTLLAHAIHMSHDDYLLVAKCDSRIVHCPLSNYALGSGIAKILDWANRGVKTALGTDISGGPSLSMRAVMLACVNVDRSLRMLTDYCQGPELTMYTAFGFATREGAACLNLKTGSFLVGYHFDAILAHNPNKYLGLEQRFQQFLYGESTEMIDKVFVDGQPVASNNSK
jgi:guanine deaminase